MASLEVLIPLKPMHWSPALYAGFILTINNSEALAPEFHYCMTVICFICQLPNSSGLGVKCGEVIIRFADETVLTPAVA